MANPRVSVIMAAYNAGAFISRALESLCGQTFADWEVIVIDDCSTDDTGSIVQAWVTRDPRVIYERLERNGGPGVARNAGFARARGEWVTILDSDDRFEPERLAALLEAADRHGADIVADNHYYYDEGADKIVGTGYRLPNDHAALTTERFVRNCGTPRLFTLSLLQPMVRRDLLARTGAAYPPDLRIGEDFYFLFLLLWKGGKAVMLDRAYYIYTMPFGAASRRESSSSRTDRDLRAWDEMAKSKQYVLDIVQRETPNDDRLIAQLGYLRDQYVREKAWRTVKADVKNRDFSGALRTMRQVNIFPNLWHRAVNKLHRTQSISL